MFPVVEAPMSTSAGRSYDLIVLGATGRQGRAICHLVYTNRYLQEEEERTRDTLVKDNDPFRHQLNDSSVLNPPPDRSQSAPTPSHSSSSAAVPHLRWAILGRSWEKLSLLLRELRESNNNNNNTSSIKYPLPDLLLVDACDYRSLRDMLFETRLLINCTRPYRRLAKAVIESCLFAGCDYVDMCSDPTVLERSYLEFNAEAVRRDVSILHGANFESVTADLAALAAVRHFPPGCCDTVESFLSLCSPSLVNVSHREDAESERDENGGSPPFSTTGAASTTTTTSSSSRSTAEEEADDSSVEALVARQSTKRVLALTRDAIDKQTPATFVLPFTLAPYSTTSTTFTSTTTSTTSTTFTISTSTTTSTSATTTSTTSIHSSLPPKTPTLRDQGRKLVGAIFCEERLGQYVTPRMGHADSLLQHCLRNWSRRTYRPNEERTSHYLHWPDCGAYLTLGKGQKCCCQVTTQRRWLLLCSCYYDY